MAVGYDYDEVADCSDKYTYDGFELDETNCQDFVQYRFVFKKGANGIYHFDKVEKM